MMGAFGLQTHIWNNNLKSILLLAGFPVLLLLLSFGLSVGYVGLVEPVNGVGEGLTLAIEHLSRIWPFAFLGAGLWFFFAWMFHQKIIEASVGAKGLSRKEAPELYNLLENLCISRGLATPKLNIIESPSLNAFASGVSDKTYKVTVTRGLIETLDRDELEAVLAHELTHIMNRDVRLLIIAVIFVGIFSFFGELLFRNMFRTGLRVGGHTRSRNGDSRGGGVLILIAIAMIVIAYLLALVIRFALSQRREYLADAGAVELTRNPNAMISALKKISGRARIDAPNDIQQMMVENTQPFAGVFATHPPIDKRIEALVNFAGGKQ
ncbi:M48 family metallopeptidase [Hyphococcus flavus]|uniref:Protease HtpX homolog n=1 Tax=Hyphococcus flavus TaxID=1866326 RepID=A0AAE9ZBZ1_9PROT|nr:M48 family metallopeptidase [Hyphococcus flavus]WDI31501.1 M48 family metallopeptidase [Hyphococcus flavus]